MRFNERTERRQDLVIQPDFIPMIKRSNFSTGIQMIEYYSPSKRDYTIRILTARHEWLATQDYNHADHMFNRVNEVLQSGMNEDDFYNSQEAMKLVYER